MIKANPTNLGRFFWQNFSRFSIKYRFERLVCEYDFEPPQAHSLLMIGNHISWWDGFWPMEVNRKYLGKNYYVMMLERELAKRPFMRQGGAFSIHPGNRSVISSLQYTADLLQDQDNLVLMYPQGRIHSLYSDHFSFNKGLPKIIQAAGDDCRVIFFAAHIDFFSKSKPSLFFRMKMLERFEHLSLDTIESQYNAFYQACNKQQVLIAENEIAT